MKALQLLLLLGCLSFSEGLLALCTDGSLAACNLNGKSGTRQCIDGRFGPCDTHFPPPPPPTGALYAGWDLLSQVSDDNGIPKNASWRFDIEGQAPMNTEYCFSAGFNQHDSICSTQNYFFDLPVDFDGLICSEGQAGPIDGHVDWFDVTYQGTLIWDEQSTFDHDYNFEMVPTDAHGNELPIGLLLLEFNADETINYFHTPWWDSFRNAVGSPKAKTMLGGELGREGIVTGLVGLDCEHSCGTEVHPVHAMAIHVNDDQSDDEWAIFVRNSGNEGYCSSAQHYLDLNNGVYTFRIPWRSGMIGVASSGATQFASTLSGPVQPVVTIHRSPAQLTQGVLLVSFRLPAAESSDAIFGELHLTWTPFENAPPSGGVTTKSIAKVGEVARIAGEDHSVRSTEDKLAEVLARMTPAQRAAVAAAQASPAARRRATPVAAASTAATPVGTSGTRYAADTERATARPMLRRALCGPFNNQIPEFPKSSAACTDPEPRPR